MQSTLPATALDKSLISKLEQAFGKIDGFGSIEIYVQRNQVTQITTRNIVKTQHTLTNQTGAR